jgi:hypothetical protein
MPFNQQVSFPAELISTPPHRPAPPSLPDPRNRTPAQNPQGFTISYVTPNSTFLLFFIAITIAYCILIASPSLENLLEGVKGDEYAYHPRGRIAAPGH